MEHDKWEKIIDGHRIEFSRTMSTNPLMNDLHTTGWQLKFGAYEGPHRQYSRKEVEELYKEQIDDLIKRLRA